MSDTRLVSQSWGFHNFNPRSPRGGATKKALADGEMRYISIHAPHEGERRYARTLGAGEHYFNPRSPRGGATYVDTSIAPLQIFQSTLPTRGSDFYKKTGGNDMTKFQSTLPTRGSDSQRIMYACTMRIFQSTLPTRGSDAGAKDERPHLDNFNPRSPRGGAT